MIAVAVKIGFAIAVALLVVELAPRVGELIEREMWWRRVSPRWQR